MRGLILTALIATGVSPLAFAAGEHDGHGDMHHDHSQMQMPEQTSQPDMHHDHSQMNHVSEQASVREKVQHDHAGHSMDMDTAEVRDPHAYAGDLAFGKNVVKPAMAHEVTTGALFVNRLEQRFYQGDVSTEYDVFAWYGKDYQRLVLKAEGEVNDSRLEEARTELLFSSAVSSFWDAQIGLRQDSGDGPNRTWLAAGFQGLAPYWFEVDATAYVSDSGRAAFRLEADYELLLTQKLILQPRVEATYYTKSDVDRGIGDDFSALTAGLRLRYEFVPEFAPYIGVEWQNAYGETKSLMREEGEDARRVSFVAGVKFWF